MNTAPAKASPSLRSVSGDLDVRTLLRCFLRCYLIGAAYNTRGLQHVGLAYAMYFKNGRAKVEIALARGKKVFDRRDDLKARDLDRDAARELERH